MDGWTRPADQAHGERILYSSDFVFISGELRLILEGASLGSYLLLNTY